MSEKPKQNPIEYYVDDIIPFADIVVMLARQFKVIIIFPIFFCIFTAINVEYYVPPVYTSTSKIISPHSGGLSRVASKFGMKRRGVPSIGNLPYTEIINSKTFAKRMLNQKFNTEKYGPEVSLLQILTYGNGIPSVGIDTLSSLAVDEFHNMIEVSSDDLSIITLSVNAIEPQFAKEVNETIIKELNIYLRVYNGAESNKTKLFIEKRIIENKIELNVAEEALKNFAIRNRQIGKSPFLKLEKGRFKRDVSVLTSIYITLKEQLEMAKIDEVRKTDSDYVSVIDQPEVPLEHSKPNKKLNLLLAGILGIGIGVLVAFLREFAKNITKNDKKKLILAKQLVVNNILGIFSGISENKKT